jgi:hypothetical protein
MHRRELRVRRLLSRRISHNEHETLVHAPPAAVEIVRRKSGQTVLIETRSQTWLDLASIRREPWKHKGREYWRRTSPNATRRRLSRRSREGGLARIGISEITVKAHRGQMMRKMKADSLPALVTMASRLGLPTGAKDLTVSGPPAPGHDE